MPATEKIFGLIGGSLKNTFSKDYFTQKFEAQNLPYVYQNFELKNINELLPLIAQNKYLCGLNVTIPFKESVLPLLTQLHESAAAIGAVNCIKINRSNDKLELIGYNTDAFGFKRSLQNFIPSSFNGKALILGSGGASKAVQYVCNQLNIPFLVVTSSYNKINQQTIHYNQLDGKVLNDYLLIINTTPLGMYPSVANCPDIPYAFLTPNHYCFDLIYLPTKTQFLINSESHNSFIMNGLEMLHKQADYAFDIFMET